MTDDLIIPLHEMDRSFLIKYLKYNFKGGFMTRNYWSWP
jgi:hypothetical protein